MRLDIPDNKKLVFEIRCPIRWSDMDAMGHVNNAVYFTYWEVARVEWLTQLGHGPDPAGNGPVVVNAFCNFLEQVEYPGEVLIKLYVANPGRSSFDTFLTLERVDQPGKVLANGGATMVWVNAAQRKSVPLPERLRALL